jgi:hypothetical protein
VSTDGNTIRPKVFWWILRWHSYVLDVRSFRGTACDSDHCLIVAKVMDSLALSRQTTQFCMEKFNPHKLNKVESKEQFQMKISNRFVTLENINEDVDSNRAWGTIRENTKI